MDRWSLTLLEPWWLLGLLVLPTIVYWSYHSLAGLGRVRRWLAILLRSAVITLLLLALANVQWVRESDQVCTLFLVDESQSIPSSASEESLRLVSESIQRRPRDQDLAGLVGFGKNARIELPPARYPRDRTIRSMVGRVDRQFTDLSSALQLALGSFPPNASGRIVLISDGNQNRGNALAQASAAAQAGIPIDVVPIEYRYDSEVLVDQVAVPAELRRGDTANLKVVIRSGRPATGILRLSREVDRQRETLAEQRIELRAGVNVHYIRQTIDEPNFYNYEATFEPDAGTDDRLARNNTASAFTWIRGEGRVLFIEPAIGDHALIVDSLKRDNIVVVTRTPEQLSDDLAELRPFDAVILANVPAESLGEKRQELIATNTRVLGAGLLMIGGPDSFGPGGYNGSPIETALPVDMEVKNTKITGKGALVMIMHACEMPEGNFWQKKTAQLAVNQLSTRDECGVLEWNGKTAWVFKLQEVGDKKMMLSRIGRMTPSDMPDFAAAMQMGFDSLSKSDALTKHTIIISDGDPQPPTNLLLSQYKEAKISITTVAIAAHGAFERQVMRRISSATGGRYYEVNNAKALPEIYTKETRTVSRPLIFEQAEPWSPVIEYGGEPIAGLARDQALPAIKGFVLTTPKETAIVEINSPLPAENSRNPILAHWQYGLGRSAAVTTDAGDRWAVGWPGSEIFGKFWSQLVRWTMRVSSSDRLQLSVQEQDGEVKVVVNAITPQGDFLNMLPLEGSVVAPDASTIPLKFEQTEPGKYEANFPADQSGSYMIRSVAETGEGKRDMAISAMNIAYPAEFRETASNRGMLENIALTTGGRVLSWEQANAVDFFERSAQPIRRLQDAWPWVLLTALGVFLFDVAIRRIALDPREIISWVAARARLMLGRSPAAATEVTIDRLRSVKAKVSEELKGRRFTVDDSLPTAPPTAREDARSTQQPAEVKPKQPSPPPAGPTADAGNEGTSPTERLLKAKRQVWEDRDKEKNKPNDPSP